MHSKPKAGVINYGAGNIGNVLRALTHIGIRHSVLGSPSDIGEDFPDVLILPGVGAFRPAKQRLDDAGWTSFIKKWADEDRPLVGICLGMQLMCRASSEDGHTDGLGAFDADVVRLEGIKKIPHIGWNSVEWSGPLKGAIDADLYFVHSYAATESRDAVGITEVDGVRFCSSLARGRSIGFQFHPERSGPAGVAFFGDIIARAASKGGLR